MGNGSFPTSNFHVRKAQVPAGPQAISEKIIPGSNFLGSTHLPVANTATSSPTDRRKFGAKPQYASDGASPSANPIELGVCGPEKADRPWLVVAGALGDTKLRLATLPVDKAARVNRLNRNTRAATARTSGFSFNHLVGER
jgi:hypothetical protein